MNTTISIIIPVFNEQSTINHTIERLLNMTSNFTVEIIIADEKENASTLKALESRYQDNHRIIKTVSKKGRGPQMNHGAAVSSGEILWFLHADTTIDRHCLDIICEVIPRIGKSACGAFDLTIASTKPIFRLIETVASMRSRLTKIPYGDQGIFMTRQLFNRIGGYGDIPIMEDVEIMKKIKKRGIQPMIFHHGISTSSRRWESQGIFYTTLRNWLLITLYHLGMPPRFLAKYYSDSVK